MTTTIGCAAGWCFRSCRNCDWSSYVFLWADEALAAAETVARLQGHWGVRNSYTANVDAWVEKTGLSPSPALARKAHAAIDRVLAETSEIVELWEESGDLDEWKRVVDELRSRIHLT